MEINRPAPGFTLPDQRGKLHALDSYRGQVLIVNFWSAECPWSERADKHLLALLEQFRGQVALLPIAANANETDELINAAIQQRGLDFVLRDTGCQLADLWAAQTTPHAFVIDRAGILRYRGAVDDVTFRKHSPERFYVREAVAALLAGSLPEVPETPAYGCTIVRSL